VLVLGFGYGLADSSLLVEGVGLVVRSNRAQFLSTPPATSVLGVSSALLVLVAEVSDS